MKKLLLFFLILMPLLSYGQGSRLVIKNIPEKEAVNDRWVYLVVSRDYQKWFVDSLFIKKGTRQIEFNNITKSCKGSLKAMFINPLQTVFLSEVDDKFDLTITINEDGTEDIEGIGGRANIEDFENSKKLRRLYLSIRDSINKCYSLGYSRQQLADLEESLMKDFNKKRLESYFRTANSPYPERAYIGYLLLIDNRVHKDTIQVHLERMKQRFPDDSIIQKLPGHCAYEPANEETIRTNKRLDELLGGTSKAKEKAKANPNIVAYKVGDVVEDIKVADAAGKLVALSDIKTEYVFVDFWASWCIPCRLEFEHLKRASADYEDYVTIFSVSIDSNKDDWTEAIKNDGVQMFVQTLLGDSSQEAVDIMAKFGVKAIPANFLLNKKREIIAVNLRGKALSEKLKELCGKVTK